MADGLTCYERDEAFCEDQMCLRTGCRIRNERLASAVTPGRDELAELLQSMPGEIELAGIIHDTADAGTSEEYCSWTMANRAAEAVAKRLATVRLAAKPADEVDFGFDLRETLRAVLENFGVDGAAKVTRHVMMARRSRDSNAEIDRLEELFSTPGEPKLIDTEPRCDCGHLFEICGAPDRCWT